MALGDRRESPAHTGAASPHDKAVGQRAGPGGRRPGSYRKASCHCVLLGKSLPLSGVQLLEI